MHPIAKRQRLEVLIGVLSFFTLMAFVNALGGIVTGEPGVLASLVLALFVGLLGVAIVARRRVGTR